MIFLPIAEDMDSGDLGAISSDLISQYVSAKESRGDWEEEYDKGLDLLGFDTRQSSAVSQRNRRNTLCWRKPF